MKLPFYQIDAFAEHVFEGNPAAVVPLEKWLPDKTLLAIAAENNLAETAFFAPTNLDGPDKSGTETYRLRWFTPCVEVQLCGHATLATAHLLFSRLRPDLDRVVFRTMFDELNVSRGIDGTIEMDFPARPSTPCVLPQGLEAALGSRPACTRKGSNLVCIFDRAEDVAALRPNPLLLEHVLRPINAGLIATAPGPDGSKFDFVSRFFAPVHGIAEDSVTGSAHCDSTPYWAKRLGRNDLLARQISKRGGTIGCRLDGTRVFLSGRCRDYLVGEIIL